MDERRKDARHRTLKGGHIHFNRAAALDCRVRNMSPHGALLEVDSQIGVPDAFTLAVDGDRHMHACRVVWRIANRIGVEFEDRPASAA